MLATERLEPDLRLLPYPGSCGDRVFEDAELGVYGPSVSVSLITAGCLKLPGVFVERFDWEREPVWSKETGLGPYLWLDDGRNGS